MCAVTNAVLYVTVCVIFEPRSSVKCILLSFFISGTIPFHFYAINFYVCFVFCSCHLLWFPQLLNLLGITQPFGGVFNWKPSSALVRTETLFTLCWSQCGVSLLLAGPVLSGNISWGNTKGWRAGGVGKAFHGAAGCSLEPRALLLSFFLYPLLLSPLSFLPSLPPFWGIIRAPCGCWGCNSAEADKTRRDLSPLSCCVSE